MHTLAFSEHDLGVLIAKAIVFNRAINTSRPVKLCHVTHAFMLPTYRLQHPTPMHRAQCNLLLL